MIKDNSLKLTLVSGVVFEIYTHVSPKQGTLYTLAFSHDQQQVFHLTSYTVEEEIMWDVYNSFIKIALHGFRSNKVVLGPKIFLICETPSIHSICTLTFHTYISEEMPGNSSIFSVSATTQDLQAMCKRMEKFDAR